LRVLLDEMITHEIARGLRERGRDVIAVSERPELRGLPDSQLLDLMVQDQRAIVTYNRDDYLVLDRDLKAAGKDHAGMIIVSPARFRPGAPATLGGLVTALDEFLSAEPAWPGFVHWL